MAGGAANPAQFMELLGLGYAPLVFASIDTDVLAQGLAARAHDWRARLARPDQNEKSRHDKD